jgi:heavy metal translocating P-type ATPase
MNICLVAITLHLVLFFANSPFDQWPLWALFLVALPPISFEILKKIVKGDLGADLLALIAIVTAVVLQENLACALVIFMVTSGQVLEQYAVKRASSVLQALAKRMPAFARRKIGDEITEVALDQIMVGDLLVVAPHEVCPVDGIVVEGLGSMDESYLTGEPYHVPKSPGVTVLSGAINQEALLVVLTQKIPADSRYSEIIKVMAEAEANRPPMRRLADQLGAIFAPVALGLAILAWLITGDAVRFLAVLVVATPCPLLIAIPITIISAISLAAKRGIIIKNPLVLERLPTCRTAIFDKTGTLTYGQPELTAILPAAGFTSEQILRMVASLERYSRHPLAGAVVAAATKQSLGLSKAKSVSEKPGQGLSGVIEDQVIEVTSRSKMAKENPAIVDMLPPTSAGLECQILVNHAYAATLQFRDAPRAEGASFIGHLAPLHAFNRVMIVSGDRESEVAYLGKLLGIKETLSSQTPEQKLAIVRAEAKLSPTLFVGDGINDAPALAAATVGIAFGSHSDVTAESAGAVILENDLVKVDELLHLSQKMRAIALQSAIGGMALSLIAIGFAATGYLPPVAGALVQEGIDVLAILNALRLTWQKTVVIDLPGV